MHHGGALVLGVTCEHRSVFTLHRVVWKGELDLTSVSGCPGFCSCSVCLHRGQGPVSSSVGPGWLVESALVVGTLEEKLCSLQQSELPPHQRSLALVRVREAVRLDTGLWRVANQAVG